MFNREGQDNGRRGRCQFCKGLSIRRSKERKKALEDADMPKEMMLERPFDIDQEQQFEEPKI
jgi:hypothetical protein